MLANLLTNAIEFTPDGGHILIKAGRVEDELHCSVRDTGMGVPTDMLEAIVERFSQLANDDRRGLGLGLYISRAIITAHSGRIWAESTVGKGTCISFALPVS